MYQTSQANNITNSQSQKRQTQLRKDADAILRDIAFVLKMTERVREEMNEEQKTEELVLA
jgi:riboflavin biosynthesis pyrimidine reductase